MGIDARLPRQVARDVPPNGRAEFTTSVTSTYRVVARAEGHGACAKQVNGTAGAVEILLPVASSAVIRCEWPDPPPVIPGIDFGALLELDGGPRGEHDGHGGMRVAALLNIWAKMSATWLGVTPAAAFVEEVLEVRVDRLIVRVSSSILEALADSVEAGLVDRVPSNLHTPPPGYRNGPSVKTPDDEGNLQISIFVPQWDHEEEYCGVAHDAPMLADVDIDKARGFRHLIELLENIDGDKTNQIDVHEILVAAGVDPGWRPLTV